MTLNTGGPLVLVGAGKMGAALLAGWLDRGLAPGNVHIREPSPSPDIESLVRGKGLYLNTDPDLDPAVIVLAVKPQIMDEVLSGLKGLAGKGTVALSIAAGRTLASIEKHFPKSTAVVRSMPNTPAAIGRGISVACANAHVTAAQKQTCDALLQAAGVVAWTGDEAMLDPVTAVSGSGPAYVFLLAECLEEAGVEAGLERTLARTLARETVSGAGELLRRSDQPAATLRENVTSPGGTTAAALEVLMGPDAMRELMIHAVAAAAARSRELSS